MADNYVISIKNRENPGFVTIPTSVITNLLDDSEPNERLHAFFSSLESVPQTIHDKQHLLQIVNWQPEGGLPLTEMTKWLKLAKRVDALDEEKDGPFTLSQYQADLIWNRLKEEQFIYRGLLTGPFISFVLDFQEVTGRHFEDEDPTKEEG